jgi:hypothetical protein
VETSTQCLVHDFGMSALQLSLLVENPLFQVLALVVVASLLLLLGQGLGLSHRLPSLAEKLLSSLPLRKRRLQECHILLPPLLFSQDQRLRLLPDILGRGFLRGSPEIIGQALF